MADTVGRYRALRPYRALKGLKGGFRLIFPPCSERRNVSGFGIFVKSKWAYTPSFPQRMG